MKLVNITQWVRERKLPNPTRSKASHRVDSRTEVRSLRGGVLSRGKARAQAASLNSEKCTRTELNANRPGRAKAVVATNSTAGQGQRWLGPETRGEPRPKGPTITPMEAREGNAGAWRLSRGKAGGTLSPITVLTKLAWSAQKSGGKSLPLDGQQQPCRLWSRKPRVLGPKGSLLTNRMTESVKCGSVGGVGRKPAPTRQ